MMDPKSAILLFQDYASADRVRHIREAEGQTGLRIFKIPIKSIEGEYKPVYWIWSIPRQAALCVDGSWRTP